MALVRAEGIVLAHRDLGDTSRIVIAYTREQGKLGFVAKGARTPKSRYGATMLPGAHISVVLYQRETLDLRYLSQADLLSAYTMFDTTLENQIAAQAVCELLDAMIDGEEPETRLFALTLEILSLLGARGGPTSPGFDATGPVLSAGGASVIRDGPRTEAPVTASQRTAWLLAYQYRTAILLGLRPELRRCVACRQSPTGRLRFSPRRGGVLCERCGTQEMESFALHTGVVSCLRMMESGPLSRVVEPPAPLAAHAETALDLFLRCHVPHFRGLSARELLKTLLPESMVPTTPASAPAP